MSRRSDCDGKLKPLSKPPITTHLSSPSIFPLPAVWLGVSGELFFLCFNFLFFYLWFLSDGSRVRVPEVPLRPGKEGEVVVTYPLEELDKLLRVGTKDVFVDVFTYDTVIAADNETERVTVTCSGVENVEELLFNAQQSQFTAEIFDTVLPPPSAHSLVRFLECSPPP